ncbi:protein FAR1-RELATED SEQUENCE 3-like [Triticum dicoccoides]|uniref:protein FAR1-RELATED SEQUENCE 3-like n=1 Tax=Triticum dicoccoides TaxID=85692 RepID=UPI0018907D93|nr:protein FAR1-RELATED SEQUENCE 3-like [Triticum dicoccoides]
MVGSCTCKLFETHGIPCRHLIHVLRNAQVNELPKHFVLKRFRKECKTEPFFDEDGILLEANESSSIDPEIQKLVSETRENMEELLVQAKQSQVGIQLLRDHIFALGEQLSTLVPAKEQTQTEEYEEFLGCSIPSEVDIHPPNDIRSRGRIKRLKGYRDKGGKKRQKEKTRKRKCRRHDYGCLVALLASASYLD